MNHDLIQQLLRELTASLGSLDMEAIEMLAEAILQVRRKRGHIFGIAAGRMKFVMNTFIMRLNQMNIPAGTVDDTYCPPLTPKDLVIAASSSGHTHGIIDFTDRVRKEIGAPVWAVTGNPQSQLASLSDGVIRFSPASSTRAMRTESFKTIHSIQPMSSLNEQTVLLLFDYLILRLMERRRISGAAMNARHFNME